MQTGSYHYLSASDLQWPLPSGWSQHIHDVYGEPYYFNQITARSQWEHPLEYPLTRGCSENHPDLPLGWERHYDEAQRHFYYHNVDTGRTQWSFPETIPKVYLRMAMSGKEFSIDCPETYCTVAQLQRIIAGRCIPDGWEELRDDGGHVCYHHKDTDRFQSEPPRDDVLYRLMILDRVLLPTDVVYWNSIADPYSVVIIQITELPIGTTQRAVVSYTEHLEPFGYLSVEAGDEVMILAGPELGDIANGAFHFKYYYGRVRDREGWFAWDIFV